MEPLLLPWLRPIARAHLPQWPSPHPKRRRGSHDRRDHHACHTSGHRHPQDPCRLQKSETAGTSPPFTGGLVGYFSYDYIKYAEPTLHLDSTENADFQDIDLMLFDKLIVFDAYKQKLILIAGVRTDDLEASYERAGCEIQEMVSLLKSGARAVFKPLHLETKLTPAHNEAEFSRMVEHAKHHIFEGDIFQVVLSNPLTAKATGSLFDVYRTLRVLNPSPYMFYFVSDDVEIAGASPETLAKLENGTLYTFPLAGPRPRGKTADEDRQLEKELLADEKEIAEHNMLVDLGRNDLGRVSEIGSVKVTRYMDILRYSHVMHIGSTVEGRIAQGKDALDAIDSVLPAGTLSGAPKLSACTIIQNEESRKRGVYGGAIGYSDTWISREIWTPASASVSPIKRMAPSASSPAPASSLTASPHANIRNASTKPKPL